MHAMGGFHVLDDGGRQDLHRGCRSSTAVEHHVFLDVCQHRAPQFWVPASCLATTNDVADGMFLGQFKG